MNKLVTRNNIYDRDFNYHKYWSNFEIVNQDMIQLFKRKINMTEFELCNIDYRFLFEMRNFFLENINTIDEALKNNEYDEVLQHYIESCKNLCNSVIDIFNDESHLIELRNNFQELYHKTCQELNTLPSNMVYWIAIKNNNCNESYLIKTTICGKEVKRVLPLYGLEIELISPNVYIN